jgi:hypothetical protein
MKKSAQLFIVLFVLFFTFSAFAKSVPTGGGILPFLQAPSSETAIKGIRINPGWGAHDVVYGLDFGLGGNTTTKDFVGLGLAGGFNHTQGNATIVLLQMALGANINSGKANIGGLQFSILGNYSPGETNVYGVQFSGVGNFGKNNIYGMQIGVYNVAESVYGFQIGIVNKAKNLHGVQIGLANFNESGIPFLPIINVGF